MTSQIQQNYDYDTQRFIDLVWEDDCCQFIEQDTSYFIIKKSDICIEYIVPSKYVEINDFEDYVLDNMAIFKSFKEEYFRKKERQMVKLLTRP